MTLAVPRALTSSKSSTRAGWITPAVWTTSTVPSRPRRTARSARRAGGRRRRTARRRRSAGQGGRIVGRRDERPHRSGAAVRPVGRVRWSTSARPSQPAAPVTIGDVGRVEEGHGHQPARLVVSTKWRALRMATAITEACGLTPGASGSSEASLTRTLVGAAHEAVAVGGGAADPRRAAPSSTGGRSSRWPGRPRTWPASSPGRRGGARPARRGRTGRRRSPRPRASAGPGGPDPGRAGHGRAGSGGTSRPGRAGRARRAPRRGPRW